MSGTIYICPSTPRSADDLVGCGRTFAHVPDESDDDCVDCPSCGLFWPHGDNLAGMS